MKIGSLIMLLATVASMSSYGGNDATAEVQCVIDDYVREVVEEAKGVRVIYTNGAFDDDIRREAKRRGVELEPISMCKEEHDSRFRASISFREAVLEKGENVAIQLGFELWKHFGKELPLCSGVLACSRGMPEDERLWGIAVAERLSKRILKLYERGVVTSVSDERVRERFECVQWRIARIARIRAEREDHAGQKELALKDKELADRLDHYNAAFLSLLRDKAKEREQTLKSVTPREGLQLANARQDFTTARIYAEMILKDDPEDPYANFAMGMSYYEQKQWTRAEKYLYRCLIKSPRQAAVWNNLAMICLYTERYDEGLKLAQEALEIIPDSAEVEDTIKQLKEARDKAVAPSFTEVTVFGRSKTVNVKLPPPWDEVKGEPIDGGVVFRLPVKTSEEKVALRRLLDAEPTLRKKKGKDLAYDLVSFFDLISDDLDGVKMVIGKLRAEGLLVKIEGESDGVLRVATLSPAGLRARLKEAFHVEGLGRGRLILKTACKKESVTPRIYAERILKDDPDDPYANFVMGMSYYEQKQWTHAEEYLRRCLIRSPKQLAVWNNLAMICMQTGRYEEGLKLAHRALALSPESDEVKVTIEQIEEARDKAKEKKGESEAGKKPTAKPAPPKKPER